MDPPEACHVRAPTGQEGQGDLCQRECDEVCMIDALKAWNTMTQLVGSAGKFALQHRVNALKHSLRIPEELRGIYPAERSAADENHDTGGTNIPGEVTQSVGLSMPSGLHKKRPRDDEKEQNDSNSLLSVQSSLGASTGSTFPTLNTTHEEELGNSPKKRRGGSCEKLDTQQAPDSVSVCDSSQDPASFAENKEEAHRRLDVIAHGFSRLRQLMDRFHAELCELMTAQQLPAANDRVSQSESSTELAPE